MTAKIREYSRKYSNIRIRKRPCYEILFANIHHSDATLYVNLVIYKYYIDLFDSSFILFECSEKHTAAKNFS